MLILNKCSFQKMLSNLYSDLHNVFLKMVLKTAVF